MEDLMDRLYRILSSIMRTAFQMHSNDSQHVFSELFLNTKHECGHLLVQYTRSLNTLVESDAELFLIRFYSEPVFFQLVVSTLLVFMFSWKLAFCDRRNNLLFSFSIITSFAVYLVLAGNYKTKILEIWEPVYSSSICANLPTFVAFSRMINLPIVLLSIVISSILGVIYRVGRLMLFVIASLRIKNMFLPETLSVEHYALFFIINFGIFYIFSDILTSIEKQVISILLSAIGCFSIVAHGMIVPALQRNIFSFIESLLVGDFNKCLQSPVFFTWLVLFVYSLKLTSNLVKKTKED